MARSRWSQLGFGGWVVCFCRLAPGQEGKDSCRGMAPAPDVSVLPPCCPLAPLCAALVRHAKSCFLVWCMRVDIIRIRMVCVPRLSVGGFAARSQSRTREASHGTSGLRPPPARLGPRVESWSSSSSEGACKLVHKCAGRTAGGARTGQTIPCLSSAGVAPTYQERWGAIGVITDRWAPRLPWPPHDADDFCTCRKLVCTEGTACTTPTTRAATATSSPTTRSAAPTPCSSSTPGERPDGP